MTMFRRLMLTLGIVMTLLMAASCEEEATERIPLAIRGAVRVYLLPDSDTLTIRIQKRDLNIYENEDVLDARLLGPDRAIVAAVSIPDDGNAGKGGTPQKVQQKTITIPVAQPGVYRLHIGPQGGSDLVYGFQTDCPRYVIQGPITLNDASLGGDVFFMPPKKAFKITAAAMHGGGVQKLRLADADGKEVHTFDLVKPMEAASYVVPAERPRGSGLWMFHVEHQDVRIEVAGVGHWTNRAESYFPVEKSRWLLTPFAERVFLEPGESAEVVLEIRNGSDSPGKFAVTKQSPEGVSLDILSPTGPVELKPGETAEVRARVRVGPGAARGCKALCHIQAARVDDPTCTAGAAIRVEVGESLVSKTLRLPITLRPYEHENAQFGYRPDYPCNPPFFDLANRPYIRNRGSNHDISTAIATLEGGRWVERSFIEAIKAKYPNFLRTEKAGGWEGTKIVFDGDNHAYTILRIRIAPKSIKPLLLYSPDGFKTIQVYDLPPGEHDTEHFVGHNALPDPAPILIYEKTKDHPARFCSFFNLKILLPQKKDGKLVLGEPILVSDNCFGFCKHSGNPAPTATRDGLTHIVWGEVDDSDVPGVPTYVATLDHKTRTVGKKVFLAHAPPVNDCHNQTGIAQDSEGFLHVVAGAHGQSFRYLQSLRPNDAYSGWTEPVEVLKTGHIDPKTGGEQGRQTYLSLLCDGKDTLHIAFRQWRCGKEKHLGGRQHAALSYQRKKKGQAWEREAQPLVVAPVTGYSIWYHNLVLDRRDRLYLSYSYWSEHEMYADDLPGRYNYRAVLTSADGGETWKLAETGDFEAGMR
ncbi:MAG: BNR-4 repeat-containing protein [Planctomycetota bacterium]